MNDLYNVEFEILFSCLDVYSLDEIIPADPNASMFTNKEYPFALEDSCIFVRSKVNLTQTALNLLKPWRKHLEWFAHTIKGRYSIRRISLIKSWDNPKCKCSDVAFIHNQSVFHSFPYVCMRAYVYIRAHRCMHVYTYTCLCIVSWEILVWFKNFNYGVNYSTYYSVVWRHLLTFSMSF